MMRPDGLLKIMALACFISAIPVAGRSADNLLQDCALGKKDTARSIAACTSIILNTASAATRRANALVNRGTAYQQLNDARQSIADFSDAITLQPQLAFPWQSRGEAYLQFRDYKNAISDITNAIRIDPKWAFRYHSRANAYREIGDLDRALADYSTAISIDRTHDFRFGDRAGVYISLGNGNWHWPIWMKRQH